MDENTLSSLREALKFSPGNIPLKIHFAETLMKANQLEEAETQYTELIKLTSDSKVKAGLANIFYLKGEYSKCNVVLEEAISHDPAPGFELWLLHAKALLKEGSLEAAANAYRKVIEKNSGFRDEELDANLRITAGPVQDEEYEDEFFIQAPSISFKDVGGMERVKKEIEMKIIKPLQHADLYKAYGKKTGGGILLYGPPGCGKTYIGKATAGEVHAGFISVGLNEILDMWVGSSEKNLHQIFETARNHAPCVLFFDEIDALGASRSDMKQSAGRHLINQFLLELDGINDNNDGVLIVGATNTPWHLDPAFRRPGRFDRIIFVPPPDEEARASILKIKMNGKPAADIDYAAVARKLEHFSGADIEALIDIAVEEKLEDSFKTGIPGPISSKDLVNAAKKHKPSTQEWFSTAKNFALFANDSGIYDDILDWLKIKK